MSRTRLVSIYDTDSTGNFLDFDLRDLLKVLGNSVANSSWRIRNAECVGGESVDTIHRISDEKKSISGVELMALAEDVSQTIEGEFWGYHSGDRLPWIKIRVVDGSSFDLETSSDQIIEAVQERFRETKIH